MAVQYRKVNKTVARKAFNDNKTVVICAHKLYPFGGWAPGYHANKSELIKHYGADEVPATIFDTLVNNYTSYNCSYETGYYPAYYIAN